MSVDHLNKLQDDVNNFWFAGVDDSTGVSKEAIQRWYKKLPDTDNYIKEHFTEHVIAARQGKYAQLENSPRGVLTLCVLIDQFSRHIYRGSAEQFAYDHVAQRIVMTSLNNPSHRKSLMSSVKFSFIHLPLMHSEDKALHELSVQLCDEWAIHLPEQLRSMAHSQRKFAVEHKEQIDKFGRYPYRNDLLKRQSTPEELEYIKTHPGWL